MWNFLSRNPEIILFLLVGGASLLGRLKKAVEAGQGPGGIRIPPPAEIRTKNPIPPRAGQTAPPARVQPIRRPGRPKPGRPQSLRRPTPPRKQLPPPVRPVQPKPVAEGPQHAADQPIESSFDARRPAETPPGTPAPPSLRGLLASRADLRRAILTAEILGRPLALRQPQAL